MAVVDHGDEEVGFRRCVPRIHKHRAAGLDASPFLVGDDARGIQEDLPSTGGRL
jgi:hypothetical protein